MQFKFLSLASLGFLLLNTGNFVHAQSKNLKASDLDDSYLSLYKNSNNTEKDFDLSEEYSEESHVMSKRSEDCTKYHTVSGSDSCISVAKEYGISLSQVYAWNPQIKSGCPNLNNGKKYCVKKSSSSSNKITSASVSGGCSKTHKVTNSDTCDKLSKEYGISLSEFYKLNPQVDHSCENLNTGKYYCVKSGSSKTTKKTSSKKTTKKTYKKSSSKKEVRKKLQTHSAFTYYWIAQPNDYKKESSHVTVKTCSGDSIGSVAENYANALVMEGTGVVGSKIVNLGGCSCSDFKCFELVNRKSDPYGLTSYGTPLRPFVTVASNDIKKDTKIYVPSLVGWKIPGSSKRHNGCLLVDDQSWSFGGKHIDFYVYGMDNYESLDKAHNVDNVDIYEGGSCTLQNYS